MKRLSIFGATGSIGTSSLDIVRFQPDLFQIEVLTGHSRWEALCDLALEFHPNVVVIGKPEFYADVKTRLDKTGIIVLAGEEGLVEAAELPCDIHIAAIVGLAGLAPTFHAVKKGYTIALANKEALVCAGDLLLHEAKVSNCTILPVDSEHNAIFQVLENKNRSAVERVILTASGGPFRTRTRESLQDVQVSDALKHPNWSMGAKISIDSATMANKALEMVEAVYLFNLEPKELDVVIHPQSIVHSMVEYCDGSILAQMGAHDMRTAIGYALNWPDRKAIGGKRLDLLQCGELSFHDVDTQRFPAIRMMREIIRTDLRHGIVFNAANEIAVEAFLKQKIAFLSIEAIIGRCLDAIVPDQVKALKDVYALDLETRRFADDIIKSERAG